jgi:hypothetical protein
VEEHHDPRQEFTGNGWSLLTEKILDLSGCDEQCDAVGKADRNRAWNVLNGSSQASDPHHQQQDARHDSDQRQTAQSELHDNAATMTTNAPVGPPI